MDRADKGCDENVTTLDFCLEGAVCRKWCSQKACNIHRKTSVLESLFKYTGLKTCNFIKTDPNTGVFL